MFKLDKTAFKAGKIKNQDNNVEYWMSKTPLQRLEASWYLTCYAYGLDVNNPPAMQKNVFKRRHQE